MSAALWIRITLKHLQHTEFSVHSLAKYWVELLGDVILFVPDLRLAQLDDNVRVGLPVDVGRMKVSGLRKSEAERS